MDEIIEQLLKLQEIDTLKAELEKKRALVPRRLEEERVHWDAAKAAVREHKERLQARERERRAAEREAEELEQTVLRYQVQLNSAKTNEEYRALLNQIAHTRERASQAEDRVLVAMEDIERLERELREAEAIVLDAFHPGAYGGTGKAVDWGLAARFVGSCAKPVILAGGLRPENVGEAVRAVRPFAVDVSSGVEAEPGRKDPERLRAFFRAVREADLELEATGGAAQKKARER